MSSYLEIPQTPRAKSGFDGQGTDEDAFNSKVDSSKFLEFEDLRSLSPSPFSERGGQFISVPLRSLSPGPPPSHPQAWRDSFRARWKGFWDRNQSVILVGSAQLFGSSMNAMARILELEGEGMHPFQILFARMLVTATVCCIYMYWKKVPHFPLGAPGVRWLLVARGLCGFFGIYGMWYSIMYLPLAEATVIGFLAPCLSGYICHILLKEPFTRKEQLGTLVAMAGVVLIARPTSFFGNWGADHEVEAVLPNIDGAGGNSTQITPQFGADPTSAERLSAIGVALIGVLGGSGAFTTIRWIGKRAHPLISVNYFATWATLVSFTVLMSAPALDIGQPSLHFALPANIKQWVLLFALGVCGFIMQFMMTAGLGAEKSNRATAMVYTQMLFAAGFDKWIFGYEMGPVSLVGCGMIIGSMLWVALSKRTEDKKDTSGDIELCVGHNMEAVPMMRDIDEDEPEE